MSKDRMVMNPIMAPIKDPKPKKVAKPVNELQHPFYPPPNKTPKGNLLAEGCSTLTETLNLKRLQIPRRTLKGDLKSREVPRAC